MTLLPLTRYRDYSFPCDSGVTLVDSSPTRKMTVLVGLGGESRPRKIRMLRIGFANLAPFAASYSRLASRYRPLPCAPLKKKRERQGTPSPLPLSGNEASAPPASAQAQQCPSA